VKRAIAEMVRRACKADECNRTDDIRRHCVQVRDDGTDFRVLNDLDKKREHGKERHAVGDADEHVSEEELVLVIDLEGASEVEFGVADGGGGAGYAKASACFFLPREIFGEGCGVWDEEARR